MNAHIKPELTYKQRREMSKEINQQLAAYDRKHAKEISALFLWTLHEEFEFGPKRLKRYFDAYCPAIEALIARYDMEDEEGIWLCTQKLKDYGVDLEQWDKEYLDSRMEKNLKEMKVR